ncbi:NAC domain-containing protein 96-like [Lycium ferocissimum]|uniref:NAC domain-containing protein 96-like n=1 Tax=Lycium ferocissimum TaxID=112874 RepID=UPI002814B955|nr:NAC domain-containing protein 96-like [Lycium ferocissimum]
MVNFKEGFRFRPRDRKGVTFLLRFIAGQVMNDSGFITTNVDVYGKQEPWQIYNHGVAFGNDDGDNTCSQYRYFITKLKKKNKSMYNRNVGKNGRWKQQDKGKAVRKKGGQVIGYKKSMSYENKNCNLETYGHWLMKEYQLSDVISNKFKDEERRDWLECAEKMIKRILQRGSKQSMYQVKEFLMSNTDESEKGMPEIEQQISIWSANALTESNNQQQAEGEIADSCASDPIFNWTYDASIIQQ